MADDNPYRAPASDLSAPPPAPAAESPTQSLREAIWGASRVLFQSRTALLLRMYADMLRGCEPDAPPPATLEEARRRALALRDPAEPLDEARREASERTMVVLNKAAAFWILLWMAFLPGALVLGVTALAIPALLRDGEPVTALAFLAATYLVALPLLSILGLFLQSILLGPFNAVMTRVARRLGAEVGEEPPVP